MESTDSRALPLVAGAGGMLLFRPDLTLMGATDLLGLVGTVLIGWRRQHVVRALSREAGPAGG